MTRCHGCQLEKGVNKFHAVERSKEEPCCKLCIREKGPPVARLNTPELKGYELLCVVGQGAYGRVLQVRHVDEKHIYAMKIISKQFLVEKNNVAYMKSERDIMTLIQHPFVVRLHQAFQSDTQVFLVMEYQPGGELLYHMKQKGLFDQSTVQFYLAEMVLALEHLHSRGIIHRDLKPENVLLSADGHIKITDFGVAKQTTSDGESHTLCGTQEYMAPEMILGIGYNAAVDWWALGALAHEMLTGKAPFESKNIKVLQKKIISEKLNLPHWLSPAAHSLLKQLLERNVEKRLGSGKSSMFTVKGVLAVKRHSFFKGVDWHAMEELKLPAPIHIQVPANDISHFDTQWTSQKISLNSPKTVFDDSDRLFRGFSYIAAQPDDHKIVKGLNGKEDVEDWELEDVCHLEKRVTSLSTL